MDSRSNKNLKGVDLSNWQGNIDFNKIENSGYDVVILKASEGTGFIDPSLEMNYGKAIKTNLKIGMYHFMSEKSDPKDQAKFFWSIIKNKKIHVYPILDIETDTLNRGARAVTDRCLDFLDEFKRLSGYNCVVYTYTSFANTKLDSRLKKYMSWIAHYGVTIPGTNRIWDNWVGFQYTDKEKVSGVISPCDANEFKLKILIDYRTPSKPVVNPTPTPVVKPVTKKLWEVSISGNEVMELQKALNSLGAKLTVDGLFGDSTLKTCKTLKRGDKGTLVLVLQKRLISKGYSLAPFNADGSFGAVTESKIKAFQIAKNLSANGAVGADTWKDLYAK
ncbi:GH25 family lysozyme [uncultured Clostridium sp.]|uniref:GH25 family lysozyme n=1 Tax=uncultured Clostridium sp. TaxID=59620 RepID=UPI00262D402B|nr:GH25 family lysozyme [uncultured Clostridium sp.]